MADVMSGAPLKFEPSDWSGTVARVAKQRRFDGDVEVEPDRIVVTVPGGGRVGAVRIEVDLTDLPWAKGRGRNEVLAHIGAQRRAMHKAIARAFNETSKQLFTHDDGGE